jgi:hypothetical protein
MRFLVVHSLIYALPRMRCLTQEPVGCSPLRCDGSPPRPDGIHSIEQSTFSRGTALITYSRRVGQQSERPSRTRRPTKRQEVLNKSSSSLIYIAERRSAFCTASYVLSARGQVRPTGGARACTRSLPRPKTSTT